MQMHIGSLKPNVKATSLRSTFNSNEYRHINRHYYTFVECLEKVTIVMMILLLCPGFLTAQVVYYVVNRMDYSTVIYLRKYFLQILHQQSVHVHPEDVYKF